MPAFAGEPFNIRTRFGPLQARHIRLGETVGAVREGIALSSMEQVKGDTPVLLRVQSSCLFSEALGSIDCECALQLSTAVEMITRKEGLVVYVYEEGRGAGLEAKCRSMRLAQSSVFQTTHPGNPATLPDTRSYEDTAELIKSMILDRSVILLSNNPAKERALRDCGVDIFKREPLLCGVNDPTIARYLMSKRHDFGHDIPDLV